MTTHHSPFPEAVEEQASLWAVRLDDGELTAEQCAELDRWLAADFRHRQALHAYGQLSDALAEKLPALGLTANASAPTPSPAPVRALPWIWINTGLAAAAAIALLLVLHPFSPGEQLERIATTIAESRQVTLSDGTTVELNAHTNLVYEPTPTQRRVRLGSGQAFFAVTKDPARPFIVETPLGAVRVTGTAFDVRTLSADDLVVTVAEGSVEVRLGENNDRTASAPILLTGNHQLRVRPDGPVVRPLSDEALHQELAWRDGQLILDEAPLAAVLDRFAHYHGIGISAAPEVAELTLSGSFPLADLEDFLLILETVHPVRVLRDQSGTIRVVARD